MIDYKSFSVADFETVDDAEGIFSGYASTWAPDLNRDVIVKGAFSDCLADDYPDGGAKIPIHWEHKTGSPFDVVGETLSAVEDDHGLLITAKLDRSTDQGNRTYELLKNRLIHQMSIGFVPTETAWVQEPDTENWHREIRKAKLFEISVVQVAANQGAEIVEVKTGKRLSRASSDKIKEAIDVLTDLISDTEQEPAEKPAEKPADPEPAATEKPDKPDKPDDDEREKENDRPKGERKSFDQWSEEFKEISAYFGR